MRHSSYPSIVPRSPPPSAEDTNNATRTYGIRMRDNFEDDFTPPTQSSSERVPPPKVPGTAIATAAPAPLPPRRPRETRIDDANAIRRLIARALDMVDSVADTVAEGLGLRHT